MEKNKDEQNEYDQEWEELKAKLEHEKWIDRMLRFPDGQEGHTLY